MYVGNNYMGTGCAFPIAFPSPGASPPNDYAILGNDMSNPGAGTFVPTQPFINQPGATISSNKPGGGANALTGQISGNRGISLINGTGSKYFNSFPVTSLSMTSGRVYYNLSPYYCAVSATILAGSGSITNSTISSVSCPGYLSFTVPRNGSFSYSFTASWEAVLACYG